MTGRSVNNESERMQKETVVANFNALPKTFSKDAGGTIRNK
jgi:hypothetical protein